MEFSIAGPCNMRRGLAWPSESSAPTVSLSETSLLEHAQVNLDLPADASPELVRETLATVADRAIGLPLKHLCGTIALEKGLEKLRSSGKKSIAQSAAELIGEVIFVPILT